MKKRVSGLLIALAMVALVVAGCSNNDKKEEKKDRAEADIEWQMISPEDMKRYLKLMIQPIIRLLIFNQKPTIKKDTCRTQSVYVRIQ